jgi:hypothetical protein
MTKNEDSDDEEYAHILGMQTREFSSYIVSEDRYLK